MVTDARIGTELAGYRIESLLGRGGMSVVYLAEDTRLGRRVALKLLAPELSQNEAFRERFVRESRLAASLDHPNIVPVFEAGEAEGVLFIAMRHVRGVDLRTLIARDGPLSLRQASRVITQVASALDEAHDQGLVHRDVKTANVLMGGRTGSGDAGGHVYLSDFGLTKQALAGTGLTGTGQFMGSIDYAAPEQFQGKALDARTDVYALGCVLFECLTGKPPFRRDSEAAVLYAHLSEPPPSVTSAQPDLPADLDTVVSKAMAKEPGDRFERAGDLAEALQAVAGGDAPAGLLTGSHGTGPTGPTRNPSRRRALWLGAAALLLAAVVVGVLVASSGGGAPGPSPSPSETSSSGPLVLGTSVVRVDPVTNKPDRPISVPGGSDYIPSVTVGEGGVWAGSFTGLAHLDLRTGDLVADIPNPAGLVPAFTAIGYRSVWVGYTNSGTSRELQVARIDPATDEVDKRIPLGYRPSNSAAVPIVVVEGGPVWTVTGQRSIGPIDPVTNRLGPSIRLTGDPLDLAVGEGSLWVLYSDRDYLTRLNPRTGAKIADVPLVNGGNGVAVGNGAVWVITNVQQIVSKIDPDSNTVVDQLSAPGNLTDIGVGEDGTLWVTTGGGDLLRVDPNTRKVTTIPFVGRLDGIAVTPDGVWIVSRPRV